MSSAFNYKPAYEVSECNRDYGPNGLLLFALSMRFNIDDVKSLASNCLTDGADDKKIDAVFIDAEELETAVIIQSYFSTDATKTEAPSNKASDLNTAITWAFTQPVEGIPERIRSNIQALREAVSEGDISNLEFWYVHNLNESKNVENELKGVERSASSALSQYFPESSLRISALEVGNNTIEEWFMSQSNSIIIPDEFSIDVYGGYEIEGKEWKSYCTAIPARWLYEQYNEYGTKLFSANIRGYLGSRKSDRNINTGIKDTCENDPINFWAYNNGITCLVHDYLLDEGKITFKGLAIVNGAQTTGAIGSIGTVPEIDAYVPTRFIMCEKKEILENIIRIIIAKIKFQLPIFEVMTKFRSV